MYKYTPRHVNTCARTHVYIYTRVHVHMDTRSRAVALPHAPSQHVHKCTRIHVWVAMACGRVPCFFAPRVVARRVSRAKHQGTETACAFQHEVSCQQVSLTQRRGESVYQHIPTHNPVHMVRLWTEQEVCKCTCVQRRSVGTNARAHVYRYSHVSMYIHMDTLTRTHVHVHTYTHVHTFTRA